MSICNYRTKKGKVSVFALLRRFKRMTDDYRSCRFFQLSPFYPTSRLCLRFFRFVTMVCVKRPWLFYLMDINFSRKLFSMCLIQYGLSSGI